MNESRRSVKRIWMPVVGSLIIVACCLAYYFGVAANDDRFKRVMSVWYAGMALFVWNCIWLIGFSGLSWSRRIVVFVVAIAGLVAARMGPIREIHFDGDMGTPVITWRWEPKREDIVRTHRQSQNKALNQTLDIAPTANDFIEYRGEKRDGVVTGMNRPRDWKPSPRVVWKQPCGEGYSGYAVVGDLAITMEQRGVDEAIVAYHTTTGREIWDYSYHARFAEPLGGDGPRATPTVRDGKVYSLGANGKLTCLDAPTGKLAWEKDILTDNDNIQWGMSGSPLVDDKLVIVNPGSQRESAKGRALIAFDRITGREVWHGGDTKAAYSSPMFATLDGVRQVLMLDGEVFAGYDAADGKKLWSFDYKTYQFINVAQPLVLSGDRVFISASYDNPGSAMLQIKRSANDWKVDVLWRNKLMRCKFTSPVEFEGHLYGLDEGILVCLNAATGKRTWKGERFGHGQLLRDGNHLAIFAETGFFAIVEANPERYHELSRISVFDETKNWNPFAIARGKAYLRNHKEMACLDLTP